MTDSSSQNGSGPTRRDFIQGSLAVTGGALASGLGGAGAYAAGTDRIRIGLVGCGRRGCVDARNNVNAAPGIELYAMGDLFQERKGRTQRMGMTAGHKWLSDQLGDKQMNVPKERQFVGWDAYQKVIDSDIDLVLLTTPPHFRPMMARAAAEAGKHVFMEKPIAVDPVGVRSVIESAKIAGEKGNAFMGGTQWRHRGDYIGVLQRVRDGQIGEPVAAQAYYNTAHRWGSERQEGMSDLEWQIRNWYYFTWMSGDHIVEQDIHKIDILNGAFGGPPVSALGMGGRISRTSDFHGNVFDHFTIEYEYENGARATNMCQQIKGATRRHGEYIIGTKGKAVNTGGRYGLEIVGERPWKYPGKPQNPSKTEHEDLIKSIRKGEPINDGKRVAESTLTAIMGRMSAYTGRELSWEWIRNASKQDLGPKQYKWGGFEPEPVAVPGQTELV